LFDVIIALTENRKNRVAFGGKREKQKNQRERERKKTERNRNFNK